MAVGSAWWWLMVAATGLILFPRGVVAPECTHPIYCRGRLLHEVQMKSIFPDSKTFVDMKLKLPEEETISAFDGFIRANPQPSREALLAFVQDNFDPCSSEFEKWNPPDWKPVPAFLKKIKDPRLWEFGKKLNNIWKFLGRKITDLVRENQELYSIIYIPYGVIVPGGRFREVYYWDSYWVIRGLMKSEMYYTARGIIANLLFIIRRIGLVPNGGRIYYSGRSQPPMVIPMVRAYLDVTGDIDFLREHLDTLELEFDFWMRNRTVTVTVDGTQYRLARYYENSLGPRPESYREDYHTARIFQEHERNEFYNEMRAGAESGHDFSSRWFIGAGGTNKGNLAATRIRSIIPVDLNAILQWNAALLARFAKEMGLKKKALKYSQIAREMLEAIDKVLWNEKEGIWLDYDMIHSKPRNFFYATNFAPLWTGCFYKDKSEEISERVLNYIREYRIMDFPGGVPTSFMESGQQWDYPNAWPPLQDMVVSGLENLDDPRATRMAKDLALRWVWTNYRGWVDTKVMHEKYDATVAGSPGAGGEYESQMGFGWSNGLVLDLMDRYAEQLIPEEGADDASAKRPFVADYCKVIMALAAANSILRL